MDNIRFLGVHISEAETSWTLLRRLQTVTAPRQRASSVSAWYGSCAARDKKDVAWVVKTAPWFVGSTPLPDLDSLNEGCAQRKARCTAADPTHPGNGPFAPPSSGKSYRTLKTQTGRLRHSLLCAALFAAERLELLPDNLLPVCQAFQVL